MVTFSGELVDDGEDPLQLEPKRIKRSINVVIKYPCDSCEYSAAKSSVLKRHIEIKHKGLRYLCDKWEYATTTSGNLKTHIESKHEGFRYPCDECE